MPICNRQKEQYAKKENVPVVILNHRKTGLQIHKVLIGKLSILMVVPTIYGEGINARPAPEVMDKWTGRK